MTTLHKAAQMALDALEWCEPAGTVGYGGVAIRSAAITALREALAAPEPEPVAEVFDTFGNSQDPNKAVGHVWLKAHYFPPKGAKLYAAPPAAPAPVVPLTDEQIDAIRANCWSHPGLGASFNYDKFARAIERAHGITGASK